MNKMREAFELWYETTTESEDDLTYHEWMWRSWQAALSQPAAVEGWKLVPVDPTSNQMNEGADAMREAMVMFNSGRSVQYASKKVYDAMLSAAPPPPSAPAQQSVREAFESYQLGRFQYADISRDTDGRYWHAPMELEWETWQSALSTSPLLDKNDQADKCPACNGNDLDAPCAYTTEKPAGCLRVARLWPKPDSNELVELRRDAERWRYCVSRGDFPKRPTQAATGQQSTGWLYKVSEFRVWFDSAEEAVNAAITACKVSNEGDGNE
jgi:hypothetical protein